MLGDRDTFLREYAIPERMFEEAGISWEELCAIAEDYSYRMDGFYMIRDMFLKELIENREEETGLHSYRTRIKTPEHLAEKIIRRRVENYRKYKDLAADNYLKFVTDIIGFRGLLLYREDWVVFHKYLLEHFENKASWYVRDCLADFDESRDRYMAEAPKVHMRPGDFADIYADWIASDDIYDQKYYRSVHYILKYRGVYLEVQVRTLFEEGWGEIDHHILYPYKKQDPMLAEFSELLNRLAGMGDEMASFYRRLQNVPGDAFLDKKSMVDVRRGYEPHQRQVSRVEMEKIETVGDAIASVLSK
ncbi:MAG: GTP pyrophosphokinase [Eubacteriales bacterium]|nr:GTP pyrophosphokinase [Eubacteriales bacterium]